MIDIVRIGLHKQLQRTDRRTRHPDSSTGITSQVSATQRARWQAELVIRPITKSDELNESTISADSQDITLKSGGTSTESTAVDSDLPRLESHFCSNCSEAASQRCPVCKITYYCSRLCQSLEWKHFHKPLCQSYQDFQQRPLQDHKRALFFPVDSRDPRWIWVLVVWRPAEDREPGWEEAKLGDLLGADEKFPEHRYIQHNPKRQRDLANTITVSCRGNFIHDDSPFNLSIAKTTNGSMGHRWKGPAVCLLKKGIDLIHAHYGDLGLSDMRDVVDYFDEYHQDNIKLRPAKGADEIPGVHVSCEGDRKTFGYEQFTTVAVSLRYYNPGEISGVSRRVGFPLLVGPLQPDILWQHNHETAYVNKLASWLFVNDDPASDNCMGWGWIPPKWADDLGSVLVTRLDRGLLTPLDVEVMCHFCRFHLQPLFENSLGAGVRDMTKEEVLAEITPEKYALFRKEYLLRTSSLLA